MHLESSYPKGIFFMLLSATGLACVGLFGQLIGLQLSLVATIFWRFVCAFSLCFLFLGIREGFLNLFHIDHIRSNLLRAFFVLTSQYCFFYYLERNTLFNATVLLNTGPLFIPLIERGIFGHAVSRATWVGVLVSFLGVLCILQPDKGIFSFLSLVGLIAGLGQGASQTVFGRNAKETRAEISVLHLFLLCLVISAIPYFFWGAPGEEFSIIQENQVLWLLLAGLGIASTFNQLARARAYQLTSPSRLAAFFYFSVILSGLFDWWLFGKQPNFLSVIGAALTVLGGVLKVYLTPKHPS